TYGAADSGESYLRKFVDWQLNIPKPRADKFARKLYDDFNLQEANVLFGNDNILNGYKPMIDAIGVVAGSFNLTLRQIAQIFTDINLYIRKLPKNDSPFSFTLGLVASLRHAIPPEKLRSYCGGKDDYEALIQGLIQSISPLASSDLRDKLGRWKPHFLAMFLNKEHESSLVKEWKFLEEQKGARKLLKDEDERYNYVIGILEASNAYANIRYNGTSVARIVLDRLEGASFLTDSNG
ncbi:MAG: hypothetical protein WCD70_02840, partial [Alphaproteobacteria bacterium]